MDAGSPKLPNCLACSPMGRVLRMLELERRHLRLESLPIACVPVRAEWFSDQQDKMGTRINVQIWHDDPVEARRLIAMAMAEFDRIEAEMSTYRADSEISGINAHAAEHPVPASAAAT